VNDDAAVYVDPLHPDYIFWILLHLWGKTMNDRSNGAKVTSAGLLALSILIAFGV
jgi:hypothetical protein